MVGTYWFYDPDVLAAGHIELGIAVLQPFEYFLALVYQWLLLNLASLQQSAYRLAILYNVGDS